MGDEFRESMLCLLSETAPRWIFASRHQDDGTVGGAKKVWRSWNKIFGTKFPNSARCDWLAVCLLLGLGPNNTFCPFSFFFRMQPPGKKIVISEPATGKNYTPHNEKKKWLTWSWEIYRLPSWSDKKLSRCHWWYLATWKQLSSSKMHNALHVSILQPEMKIS